MPTTREELIADWQRCLATAETAPVSSSQRQAWLVLVRVRLYRFLLSLYGRGDWSGNHPIVSDERATAGNSDVIFDSPAVLPLAGKPAKGDGKIREVLKAVASAQIERPASGPWIQGLPQEEWIVVVAFSSGLDPARCTLVLDNAGIVNRRSRTGSIVVPAVMAPQARAAIRTNAAWLRRPRPPRVIRRPLPPAAYWILAGLTFAPLAAVAALLIASAQFPHAYVGRETGQALAYALALFATFMSIIYIRPIGRLVVSVDHLLISLYKRLFSRRTHP